MYKQVPSSPPASPAAPQGNASLSESDMQQLMFWESHMVKLDREESLLLEEGDKVVSSFKDAVFGSLKSHGIAMAIIAFIRSISDITGVTLVVLMSISFLLSLSLALFGAYCGLMMLSDQVVPHREIFASYYSYVGKFVDYAKNKLQNSSASDSFLTDRLNTLQQKTSVADFFYLIKPQIFLITLFTVILALFLGFLPFTVEQNAMTDTLVKALRSRGG